jgi:phosphoglycolate phosphatase-like HAD superfamily hydrolase
VILDFDGTLVDSMPFLTDVATALLVDRYGMRPAQARKAYKDTSGLPFVRQMEILFPGDGRNPDTVSYFEAQKEKQLPEFHLFPDAKPVIAHIRDNGIKVCISSGNREEIIVELLERRSLEVDLIMGYRPGFEKGVAHFELAARTFDTTFDRMIFVGDSQRDGLTAGRAGMRFIARSGLLSAEHLGQVLPGVPVVESLGEILPILGIKAAQEGRWVDTTT